MKKLVKINWSNSLLVIVIISLIMHGFEIFILKNYLIKSGSSNYLLVIAIIFEKFAIWSFLSLKSYTIKSGWSNYFLVIVINIISSRMSMFGDFYMGKN